MNIMVLLRAVGALALPAVMAYGYAGRRRTARPVAAAAVTPEEEPVSHLLPRPSRRQLRTLARDHEQLRRHDLRRADLRGVPLTGVDLSALDLRHAHLRRADLRDTVLAHSVLDYADLSGADLRGADLTGASLLETDLCGADLRGVDLRAARHLAMAHVRNVVTDRTTAWPRGFVPTSSGPIHP